MTTLAPPPVVPNDTDDGDTTPVVCFVNIDLTADREREDMSSPAAEWFEEKVGLGWKVVHEEFLFDPFGNLHYCARMIAHAPSEEG